MPICQPIIANSKSFNKRSKMQLFVQPIRIEMIIRELQHRIPKPEASRPEKILQKLQEQFSALQEAI